MKNLEQQDIFHELRLASNTDAEIACVALAAHSRKNYETIAEIINAAHFLPGLWRQLFQLCEEAYHDSEATDAMAYLLSKTSDDMKLRNAFIDISSPALYMGMYAKRHAFTVLEYSQRRAAYQICYDFPRMFPDAKEDVGFMVEWLKTRTEAIMPTVESNSNLTLCLAEHWDRIQETAEQKRARMLPTGIRTLDELLDGGFEGGDLVIVGARAGVGKTALGVSLALNALKLGRGIGFMTLEMAAFQIIRRLTTQICEIPMTVFKGWTLTDDQLARAMAAHTELSGYIDARRLFIDDKSITLSRVIANIKKYATAGCKTAVIDYIQLIRPDVASKSRSREQEIAEISHTLKSAAKEYDIVVMALAQLNKDAEGKTPTMATLRESEALNQDPDFVLLLDRPEQRGMQTAEYLGVQVDALGRGFGYLSKARNGRTGAIMLRYVAELAKFEDLEKAY